MADPAIEAAQRAWEADGLRDGWKALAVAASREALMPIREKYQELLRFYEGSVEVGPWRILDDLAKLIYTTEELDR
ncbi:hypothetical protein AB0876_28905 [Mycobacterium sp. NPDC049093]